MAYDFLKETHPVHKAHADEWDRRERLLRGGVDVIETELERFEWEEANGQHYKHRKRQAVYPGFGEVFVRTMVGHVLRDRPAAGDGLYFGGLGNVDRTDGQTEASRAEQVFYNVNGTGGDGQQLWQWVAAVFQRAGATGMRWVLTESPPWSRPGQQPTVADEQAGFRPYTVEFSPRVVTNWLRERGQLQWCVIRIRQDTRRVVNGSFAGAVDEPGYYLLVRKGHAGLGAEFAVGGWWKFDDSGEKIADADGRWDRTRGEIPISLAVWEWEDATTAADETPLPLARGGTTALDNLSVAYMNAKSAWRSNMWRAAGGPTMLLGVDSDTWPIAREQWMSGASLIGVPHSRDGTHQVQIAHSGAAAVTTGAFKELLSDMTDEAERMMIQMASSTPDSSGRSKEAGFAETKAPRLTLLAENIESFMNTTLRFVELRYGIASPSAYVTMPREFDLTPVEQDIHDFFETFRMSELRSSTLESEAMVRLAEARGLVNDENREVVTGELRESVDTSVAARRQGRTQEDELDAILAGTQAGS